MRERGSMKIETLIAIATANKLLRKHTNRTLCTRRTRNGNGDHAIVGALASSSMQKRPTGSGITHFSSIRTIPWIRFDVRNQF